MKTLTGNRKERVDLLTTNRNACRPQGIKQAFLTAIAFIGLAMLMGCSSDPIIEEEVSYDAEAQFEAAAMSSHGNGLVKQTFPSGDNPGPPLYASGLSLGMTDFGATRTDGEWVVITFVREPTCDALPGDYNLLSAPNIPAVFMCPLTIEGTVWLRDPSNPLNPVKAQHRGLGSVPIYFVGLSEFETAVMDGVLTIEDLNDFSSLLIGYASYQMDVIQFPQNGRPGMHSIVSRGELQDGRSFEHNSVVVGNENVHTTILFK
ncbi:hypothetical protein [Salinimicrobium soli]|uniref:hypothetical protein n=1 Tax=Salinimicrobium soli TaxID=1254399 RepID=UPI003AAB6864